MNLCPPDGQGRHRWLFKTARELLRQGYSCDAVFTVLSSEMRRTGPENRYDILRIIKSVFGGTPLTPKRKPTRFEPKEIRGDVDSLKRFLRGNQGTLRPVNKLAFLRMILNGAPCVCFGTHPRSTVTVPLGALDANSLENAAFVVPNPLVGTLGVTKDGRQSNRCESLVLQRWFQLVEFDNSNFQDQCERLMHLRDFFGIPLVAVVFSGRNSLHAWFNVRYLTLEQQEIFFDYAVGAMGADPSFHSLIQMSRMPFAVRPQTNAVQHLLLFNPESLSK